MGSTQAYKIQRTCRYMNSKDTATTHKLGTIDASVDYYSYMQLLWQLYLQ